MRWTILFLVVAAAACAEPLDPDSPGGPSCPEQACGGGCLDGFVCVNGACALPVSCGQMADQGCPQDGYPYGLDDCLWTGCHCYANDRGSGGTPPPPPGSCAGDVTCSTAEPSCPAGEVALVRDGCYTGECLAVGACDVPPPCAALQHESDCTARMDCAPTYRGVDCTDPSGGACTSGDSQCTCQSFEFSACVAR